MEAELAHPAKEEPRDIGDGPGSLISTHKTRPKTIHNYILRIYAASFVPLILLFYKTMISQPTGFLDGTTTNILEIDVGSHWYIKKSIRGGDIPGRHHPRLPPHLPRVCIPNL